MTGKLLLNVIEVSFSAGFVILALVLCSKYIDKRYAAKWKYWAWLLLAVRLLIPWNPDLSFGRLEISVLKIFQIEKFQTEKRQTELLPTEFSPQGDFIGVPSGIPQAGVPSGNILPTQPEMRNPGETAVRVLGILWLAGAVFVLGAHLGGYWHCRKRMRKSGKTVREEWLLKQRDDILSAAGSKGRPPVILSERCESPMVLGFLRPYIILPDTAYSKEELAFILKHELVHYRRRDTWYKLLFVTALSVHWFNPLVWLMVKEAGVDLELSCDEKVVEHETYAVRKAYTEVLFSTLNKQCKKGVLLTTQFNGGINVMKKRFQNILVQAKKRNGLFFFTLILVLLLGAGTVAACSVAPIGDTRAGKAGIGTGAGVLDVLNEANPVNGKDGQSTDDNQWMSESNADANAAGNTVNGVDSNGNRTDYITDGGTYGIADGYYSDVPVEVMIYIINLKKDKLTFDEVEWVSDSERAAELGLTEDDMPGGFFVYNESEELKVLPLSKDCTCTILSWQENYIVQEISVTELADILEERDGLPIPYILTVQNGEIVRVMEQYVP